MSPKKDDQSRSKIEESPDDADRTFANRHRPNIIGGLNRKSNSGHLSLNSPDCYLSIGIVEFYFQTQADNIFYGIGSFLVRCHL